MFNKLKQFKDLRSQAKTLQNTLSQESVTMEKNGITIIMNGNMEITQLTIPEGLAKNKLENTIKDLFNDSIRKVQKIMSKKMQEMGGFPGMG
jgi:DNA-binding protein YbaB